MPRQIELEKTSRKEVVMSNVLINAIALSMLAAAASGSEVTEHGWTLAPSWGSALTEHTWNLVPSSGSALTEYTWNLAPSSGSELA
jgi:hypothetical protein